MSTPHSPADSLTTESNLEIAASNDHLDWFLALTDPIQLSYFAFHLHFLSPFLFLSLSLFLLRINPSLWLVFVEKIRTAQRCVGKATVGHAWLHFTRTHMLMKRRERENDILVVCPRHSSTHRDEQYVSAGMDVYVYTQIRTHHHQHNTSISNHYIYE